MKTELTEKETALIEVIKDKWINKALFECGNGIDKSKFEKGINWVYDEFLKLPPPQVVYCDSLIEAVIKITIVKDFNLELDEYPKYFQKYMDKTLPEDFLAKLKDNFSLRYSYIGWDNFGWVAFYDYFTEIGVLENENFNKYSDLISSNVFECIEFEFAVFAVQPPVYIKSKNQLPHCLDGAAFEFGDSTKYYSINGFSVTEELLMGLYNETYTFEDFLNEDNEEVKSAILFYYEDRYGSEGVFNFIRKNLSEVDTYVNDNSSEKSSNPNIGVYNLFKGSISNNEIAYVRCYCPSTDRMFFLGVHPDNTNAKDAIASLYQVPKVLKEHIVSISRQGEKFSTVFDDETTIKLKNDKIENLKDYVSITGDEYFSLMQYEY